MLFGILPGTLDVLVLKALADGANHGYGVAQWIHETTDEALLIEDGDSTQPSIASRKADCFTRSGGRRTRIGVRSITA